MALATFGLYQCTGSSAATETLISDKTLNFLRADEPDGDPDTYPVRAPFTAGEDPTYSMELWARLKCLTAPDNYCQNFKWYGPATQPDDPTDKITVMAGTTGTGATPTASASSISTTSQHNNYNTPASGLAVGVVPGDSKIEAVDEKTNYLVLQWKVNLGASQSTVALASYQWSYEEA
jgi:hypothetical protein